MGVAHPRGAAQLEQVVSTLKDAETGQRGYLLTGERPYLDPYDQAVPRLRGQLERLRDLTIDNPPQTAHVLKLEQLTAERLAVLRQGLDRFQAEPDRTRALMLSRQYLLQGEGNRAMDLVRDESYGMQELERALLARREAAARVHARTALGMSGYDVARRVRMMDELGSPRLVALTGYGTDADRQKTRDAGFDVHLAKPVDPRALDALLASSS